MATDSKKRDCLIRAAIAYLGLAFFIVQVGNVMEEVATGASVPAHVQLEIASE